MAEFCKQCAKELDFETDFANLFKNNNIEPDDGETGFPVLCETCGPYCFIIDNEGTCGSMWCDGNMGTPEPHGGRDARSAQTNTNLREAND